MKVYAAKRLMIVLLLLAVVSMVLLAFLRGGHWLGPRHNGVVVLDSGMILKFGTFAQIKLRCNDEEAGRKAIDLAIAAIDDVDRLLSTYRDDSQISQVNKYAADRAVAVDEETYQLFSKSLIYSRMTDGAFDITVPPLLRVWQQGARENKLPSPEQLAEAREKAGYDKILLSQEGGRYLVSFSRKGVELDVDAIAEGYAVDKALAALRVEGVTAALVNIGGEIACFNDEESSGPWTVGIQDPFIQAEEEESMAQRPRWKIYLNNAAIATSGNYRQYCTIAGQKYSHIVDPRSGMPAEAAASVTVIAPCCADADALATALSVMTPADGIALIETLADTEAFLVVGDADDFKIYQSSGFEKHSQDPTADEAVSTTP